MGLGLPTSGASGDRTPIIKYDARAGRIFRIDRSNASGNWESDQVEITNGFQAIFDLENIETGWLSFPAGQAPDIRTVKIGQPLPDRPSDKHKAGFRVLMKLGKSSGGDVREMAANAGVSIQGMDALYDAYVAGLQDNPGKLPVVILEKTIAVVSTGQGQSSTNYRPVWAISKWVDRPAELVGGQPANEPKAEPVQQMKTTSQTAPAPAADDEEF
jgi:hypothetical protein